MSPEAAKGVQDRSSTYVIESLSDPQPCPRAKASRCSFAAPFLRPHLGPHFLSWQTSPIASQQHPRLPGKCVESRRTVFIAQLSHPNPTSGDRLMMSHRQCDRASALGYSAFSMLRCEHCAGSAVGRMGANRSPAVEPADPQTKLPPRASIQPIRAQFGLQGHGAQIAVALAGSQFQRRDDHLVAVFKKCL